MVTTKCKLSVVGIVGVPASYGGFETLVENLLPLGEINTTVYCSGIRGVSGIDEYRGAKLKYVNISANGIFSIPYDIYCIFHSLLNGSDKILVLGVSGAISIPVAKLFFKKVQFFINIDGLEWKRQKWGFFARAFLKISEAIAVKTADFVIADNQGVANYVDEQYGVTANMIAYGGDHAVKGKVDFSDGGYAFSLCRIEPENNVHLILEAFATVGFPLKFVGNWDFSKYSRDLFLKFSSIPNIELIDAVYDVSTLESLRSNCSYYVHGHSAGGTNPSLVEIMHFSKNIIAFDCSYNRYTLHNEGLYFKTSKQLVDIVEDGPDTGIHLAIKDIAVQNYSWSVIHKQYFDLLS